MKKLILFSFPTFFMVLFSYSQNPYWKPGGNINVGIDAVTPANNSLGTVVGNNISIRFGTNGINRQVIQNGGIGSNAGRIGFGNNLPAGFIPRSRLHLHHDDVSNISLRFTNFSTDDNPGDGFEVGYHATSATTNRQYAELNNHENTGMKFLTNGLQRMHINQNRVTTINSYSQIPSSGYVGIGVNSFNVWGDENNIGRGPYSLLHLNGQTGNSSIEDGAYRPWMRGGVTFTDNVDMGYIGFRPFFNNLGSGSYLATDIIENRNEFVIAWANNQNTGSVGSDDMCFRFMDNENNPGGMPHDINVNNLNSDNDLDGRHIARFTALGNMGLGPTFGEEHPIYAQPQSLQHLSYNNMESVYTQYTNRDVAVGSGTAETASDGLRIGINGDNNANVNGNALMYNQETRHILFSTNANTNAVNISTGNTLERMRITAINAPTNLAGGGYGINNPASLLPKFTRVSISYDPALPVTRPLSLLHLGYNTINANNDGWRTWMNVGTFTSFNSDHMYVGLKSESASHKDAVINWGDDQASPSDNLRFIFTSPTTGTVVPANTANGLEVSRMIPGKATTLPAPNHGMIGIGDWTTAFNITNPINAKLDIDGDLRIRTVTKDNTLTQILAIDPTDHNRVHWIDAVGGIGNNCSDPQNPLTSDYEIPLGNQNYYFTGQGAFARVAIGVPCTTPLLISKFVVKQQNAYSPPPSFPSISIAGQFLNVASGFSAYGILAEVQSNATVKVAGTFDANGSGTYHVGVYGRASGATINRAGYFLGDLEYTGALIPPSDKMFKTNVENIKGATDILRKLIPHIYKMDVTNFPQFNFENRLQYGFIAQEVEQVLPDLVHESMHPGIIDSTGNFTTQPMSYKSLNYNPLIPITVQAVIELNERLDKATLSDQNVKTNVQNLANSLDKVKQMRGVSYGWSSSAQNDMNLDSLQHIGFIAQEIAAIEPLLTFTDDSSLVHVNYDRVAPLLVESVKELDTKNHTQDSIIQALDSINNDLETRLAYLENCIRNANICTEGNRTMNTEPNNTTNYRSVELVNANSIILDQNIPNPFAENTVINYNIPAEVSEAKLLFYDLNGRIIKELIIEERGESKLTVYGTNLKTGVYTYSLIADGELIATKKMVKK